MANLEAPGILDAFLVPVCLFELAFGALGDLFGRKRLLAGGARPDPRNAAGPAGARPAMRNRLGTRFSSPPRAVIQEVAV